MNTRRNITTHRIHVYGIVQGVGFRPFVYREATRRNLTGWVRNTTSGAEILASGDPVALHEFEQLLRQSVPAPSQVTRIEAILAVLPPDQSGFHILSSDRIGPIEASILPDLATCPECRRELLDPSNRRYQYPFTNCTACGPRYSIMLKLPYDRDHTTMRLFRLCPACKQEYNDPSNRRFHAQPNACPLCGPHLAFWDRHSRVIAEKHDALLEAAQCLRQGGIVAVKGIGGFHLMADATSDVAVKLLRTRKHREEKPLAVMMPDIEIAKQYAHISEMEESWLKSPAAPIVLVKKVGTNVPFVRRLSPHIAPGNPRLGIILPYSPLHYLLMNELQFPVIATSGNLSDEPICTDEHEAVERLGDIADFFLVHNRPIAHPVDDSVMRIVMDRPLMLRNARGFSPLTIEVPDAPDPSAILGVGPHMKSTIAIGFRNHIVVSPHIGDLETVPSWMAFERNLEMLEGLYETRPTMIACDLHPHYASTRYAERKFTDPLHVQHHHAHILAVMAEHDLTGPVLGIAWDGTGYGADGTIWGGEFLVVGKNGYQRVAHLRTFPLPGGDSAAREPRRSALGVLHEIDKIASDAFTATERGILTTAINKRINTVMTSSAGRLFDAAASLLGICQRSSFEGQAAMLLQAAAEQVDHDGSCYPFTITSNSPAIIDWEPVFRALMADRDKGVEIAVIAARFHQSWANMMINIANLFPDLPVVLGGGCFQNAWLLEKVVTELQQSGRQIFWPRHLPPNDGAISVGQVLAARWRQAP
jgi:hydrogenase maturation protein HypF